jgi:hypothetical protein
MTSKNDRIEDRIQAEWLEAAPGERFLIRIPGLETNNAYSVTEFLSSPGSSTQWLAFLEVFNIPGEILLTLRFA